ncbi:hypothetical protein HanPI659440_Chr01g0026721 [Helianthus annuus]|nr:hypothetical protein HanPI659440_Chr01g0026721 [Helianthus annuus]
MSSIFVHVDFVVEYHMNSCFEMDLVDELPDASVVISLFKNWTPRQISRDWGNLAPWHHLVVEYPTRVSNASDPMAFTSDDEMTTDSGVYTSDITSTDEDDFQPFALPIFGDDVPLADGPQGEDLPLVPIPAPPPFAAVPFEEQPLDALPDGDIDLLIEGHPEGDQDGGAPMEDGV